MNSNHGSTLRGIPGNSAATRIRYWCVGAFFLMAAQTVDAQDVLTLQEASRRVMQNNPELQIVQLRIQAAEGSRQTAALRPGVELGVEVENVFGSGEFSGSDRGEYTLSLASLLELGGKRRGRMAAAKSRYALAETEREVQALDELGQLTQRFIVTLALQKRLQVSEDASRLAEESLESVKQRVNRGAVPEAERLRAEASLAQAQLKQSMLEAELASLRMSLATLWGADTADFDGLAGDLYAFAKAEAFDVLYDRIVESPEMQIFATEARLRNLELELARSQASIDVQWRVGIRHFEETGDSAVTAGVSVPLSTGRRSWGDIQVAMTERDMVGYRKQIATLTLRARLYDAWQTHQYSVAAVKQLKNSILPNLEKALVQTRQAYEIGRYRYSDLISAQRELLDARLEMIDAASTALLSQALIEQLTAVSLTGINQNSAGLDASITTGRQQNR